MAEVSSPVAKWRKRLSLERKSKAGSTGIEEFDDEIDEERREEGVGSESRATEALTKEDELKLWDSGVLSPSTPRGLLNAVFFLNGKNFAL